MADRLNPEQALQLARDVAAFYRARCCVMGGAPELEVEALLLAFYASTAPGDRAAFLPVGK